MSSIKSEPIDAALKEIFNRFFDGTAVTADVINTSRGDDDFRNTVIITTAEGEKYVLKFAANDFTFPDKIRMWQRTVEEYRGLGYYCPRIYCDRYGEFPVIEYKGNKCAVYAEEFSKYKSLEDRAACDDDAPELDSSAYFADIWTMTAKIAAKRLDYTEYPSAYCLFETFCPSDEMDEVLENALEWKKTADALPEEFAPQAQRIWRLWSENREALKPLYKKLPTSVFQADLNSTNLLIDDEGRFKGVYDFNLAGREVFLNYLMRENSVDTIPKALRIAAGHYTFGDDEKAAALPLFRCLKPMWYSRVRELKKAENDPEKIRECLDKVERLLTEDADLAGCMERTEDRMGFANAYFIIGTAYAGKSTMLKLLADKHNGILCGENWHDSYPERLDKKEFPGLTYARDLEDWHDFIRRTPEEYLAWIERTQKECEILELRMLPDICAQGRPVFVDTNISPETLHKIAEPGHVLVMLAEPDISVRRFFDRPDAEKQFLYRLILDEPDPEAAMDNYRRGLMLINTRAYEHMLGAGFPILYRDENRSLDETLALVEKAFGLS